MNARSARAARALTAAVVSTVVAAFSHVAGGGDAPGGATIALTLALASLVCVAFSSGGLSLWRLSVSVAVSQAMFHGMFTITGGAALRLGHEHSHAGAITSLAGHSSDMWLAHALAALVTTVALARGEVMVRALLALADVRLAAAAPVTVPIVQRSRPVVARCEQATGVRSDALGPLRRRGPPALV